LLADVAHAQKANAPAADRVADLSLHPGPIILRPPGGPKVQTTKPSSVWPWETTGETPDPAIRFGRFENGMRYAIQRDDNKEGEVALRFRIDVGSAFEEDHQLGYAHFLEHMAFNGSKNVPEGELVKRMERRRPWQTGSGNAKSYYTPVCATRIEARLGPLQVLRQQVRQACVPFMSVGIGLNGPSS